MHIGNRSSPSNFIWPVLVDPKYLQKRFQKRQIKLDRLVMLCQASSDQGNVVAPLAGARLATAQMNFDRLVGRD